MKLNVMTYNIASGRCYTRDEDITSGGGSVVALDCQVLQRRVSDHMPMIAQLEI